MGERGWGRASARPEKLDGGALWIQAKVELSPTEIGVLGRPSIEMIIQTKKQLYARQQMV